MPRQLAIMAILTMGVRETQGTFAPLSKTDKPLTTARRETIMVPLSGNVKMTNV